MAKTIAKLKPQARRAAGKKRAAKTGRPGSPQAEREIRLPNAGGGKGGRGRQRFQVSHFREEDFRADGLRSYASTVISA